MVFDMPKYASKSRDWAILAQLPIFNRIKLKYRKMLRKNTCFHDNAERRREKTSRSRENKIQTQEGVWNKISIFIDFSR